jgi:hypothetical protein
MKTERFKSFNYAIGMFGTSIPINMLKTYAAIFYVDRLGLTTPSGHRSFSFIHLLTRWTTRSTAFSQTGRAPNGAGAGHGW